MLASVIRHMLLRLCKYCTQNCHYILKMEWDIAEVFKVIGLYKKYSCLWDRRSGQYKSSVSKDAAWIEISKEMKKPVDEVRRKIKNLRSAYLLEKKKVDESLKKSISPLDVHKPHLFYYDKMRFLDNIVILRKPTDSFSQVSSFNLLKSSLKNVFTFILVYFNRK